MKSTGETFDGIHEPIVSKITFDIVQCILSGRNYKRSSKYNLIYRRLFKCRKCRKSLIGEKQKGLVYYRCHTPECRGTCVREEVIDEQIIEEIKSLNLCMHQRDILDKFIYKLKYNITSNKVIERKKVELSLNGLKDKLDMLTDKYIEGDIDKEIFLRKKEKLLGNIKLCEDDIRKINDNNSSKIESMIKNLGLLKTFYLSYINANEREKRNIVKLYTSNRVVSRKNVIVELNSPFKELSQGVKVVNCSPCRDSNRELKEVLPQKQNPHSCGQGLITFQKVLEKLTVDY